MTTFRLESSHQFGSFYKRGTFKMLFHFFRNIFLEKACYKQEKLNKND